MAQAQAHALTAASNASNDPDAGPRAEADFYERALRTRFRAFVSPTGILPPALALLDNVERGFPLARTLDTLAALNITALVTARHQPDVPRLHIQRLDVLDPAAAVALFAERYRDKGAVWDAAHDAAPATTVVEYLGHLPLAIELQAARAALLQTSVADLAATLQRDRSQGLLGDPTDATRTMRYSFDQSLKTLTPLQRTRFAALGLPEGPDWPRPLIERLLAGIPDGAATGTSDDSDASGNSDASEDTEPSPRALASARDDLALLVALSLASLPPPDGRVRLHPLLREYAAARWWAEPAATQADGLLALLDGIEGLVTEFEHDFAALGREEEMIVSALNLAQTSRTAPQQIVVTVNLLVEYVIQGGRSQLGDMILHWQLAALREVGDRAGEGTTHFNLGRLSDAEMDFSDAELHLRLALAIHHELGNRTMERAILSYYGGFWERRGARGDGDGAALLRAGARYHAGGGRPRWRGRHP